MQFSEQHTCAGLFVLSLRSRRLTYKIRSCSSVLSDGGTVRWRLSACKIQCKWLIGSLKFGFVSSTFSSVLFVADGKAVTSAVWISNVEFATSRDCSSLASRAARYYHLAWVTRRETAHPCAVHPCGGHCLVPLFHLIDGLSSVSVTDGITDER